MKKVFGLLGCFLLSFSTIGCGGSDSLDYSNKNNWFKITDNPTKQYDAFYVFPTVWRASESDGLYCDINNESLRSRAPGVYENQAKVLESIANMYVPFYRQADAAKIITYSVSDMEAAIYNNYPYKDVINAFEYYLNNFNNGRPFFLVGHSQGSMVIKNILQVYMKEHPDVYKRMIAAYPLGYSYEQSYFDKNTHLKFASKNDDLGVVITWNSEMLIDGKFGTYNYVCHGGALAINPITWNTDNTLVAADDPRNLGSSLVSEKFSTQVMYDYNRKYEVLIVGTTNKDYLSPLGDNSLHSYDWTFFLNNIVENVALRASKYLAK
jgi:hypothetical protein